MWHGLTATSASKGTIADVGSGRYSQILYEAGAASPYRRGIFLSGKASCRGRRGKKWS